MMTLLLLLTGDIFAVPGAEGAVGAYVNPDVSEEDLFRLVGLGLGLAYRPSYRPTDRPDLPAWPAYLPT